jgi:hypothetical protein
MDDLTNPYARGCRAADHLAGDRIGALESVRSNPTTRPDAASMSKVIKIGVNGRRAIVPQTARVAYLPDATKLLLPAGLFRVATPAAGDAWYDHIRTYNSLRYVAGADGIGREERFPAIGEGEDNYIGDIATLSDAAVAGATLESLTISFRREIGSVDANGVMSRRASNDAEAYNLLEWRWGTDATDVFLAATYIAPGEAGYGSDADAIADPAIQDQLSDFVSSIRHLNYSIVDRAWMLDEANRWDDDDCTIQLDAADYSPGLTPYTMSMIAALNLAALNGVPRLAWTRSYGTAMGLLPSPGSHHHTEYQVTDVLPENAELTAVLDAHPTGEEAQAYLRGCLSIIAAFGALHLSNDHTFRQNDKVLLRKAAVMVHACRTALEEGEPEKLAADGMLHITMRTTCHPFGLSATWGAFKNGQLHRLIAEPLQIRTTTVPPPVAKVGLVVSIMDKILALPIGNIFEKAYKDKLDSLRILKATVIANATAYSALHAHYGIADMRVLTAEQDAAVKNLLPIVAGYSLEFEIDENENPIGANFSQTIARIVQDEGALVGIYREAFAKYAEDAVDLNTLVSGTTSKVVSSA